MKNYGLDPTYFRTTPGLSWEACLRLTKEKLSLIRDQEMSKFVDSALIGGLSFARHPHLKANNPHIPGYDPSLPTTYIIPFDCNNQYGMVMLMPLPTGGFVWLNIEKFTPEYISGMSTDGDVGHFFEVDLEYPSHLHQAHDEFPVAPHHLSIEPKILSTYQREKAKADGIKISGTKLCATLLPKIRYKTHLINIQQSLRLGMKITKVHRVMQFNQSPWIKPYIDLNTRLRQEASCKAEEVGKKSLIVCQ
jgi:hypothetical protein